MSLLARAIVGAKDAERVRLDAVVAVRADGLVALASSVASAPVTEAELRAHDAITRRIHELVPSLPMRYGQLFDGEGDVAAALVARRDDLHAALARVGDRLELAVTLRWRTPRDVEDRTATSGREYLEQRRAAERERRDAEAAVGRLVAHLAIEPTFIRSKTCPRSGVAAIVAVLIARDESAAMHERVASFGERSAEVSAVVDGVFAPYSFAS